MIQISQTLKYWRSEHEREVTVTDRAPAASWWTAAPSPAPPAGRPSSSGSPGWWRRPQYWMSLPGRADSGSEPSTAQCGSSLPPGTPPSQGRSSRPRSECSGVSQQRTSLSRKERGRTCIFIFISVKLRLKKHQTFTYLLIPLTVKSIY